MASFPFVLGLAATLALGAGTSAQRSARGQISKSAEVYSLAKWNIDFDNDGARDTCSVMDRSGKYTIACTLASKVTFESAPLDLGYPEGRAWADFNGDKRPDFCRVVGTGNTGNFAICTLSDGNKFGLDVISPSMDLGDPQSRKWTDVNGDGMADFCRNVGKNQELLACTLSAAKSFGRTITNLKG